MPSLLFLPVVKGISLEQGVYGFYLTTLEPADQGGSGLLWCLCGNDMVNGTALV